MPNGPGQSSLRDADGFSSVIPGLKKAGLYSGAATRPKKYAA
jgi:hypothetical protein